MKNRNICSAFYRIVCLLICVTMALSMLGACNSANESQTETIKEVQEDDAEYAFAIRAVDDIRIGDSFTAERLETVRVRTDALPADICSSIDDLGGKYAVSQICVGDFITAEKISDKKPDLPAEDDKEYVEPIDPHGLGYVVITNYLPFVDGEDYTPAIQKAIEENPGKTIYFPDGNYSIKSPIVIPAEESKSVSLRLSNQAVIRAEEWGEDKTVAMIQIGCAASTEAEVTSEFAMDTLDFSSERSISIIGGCLYGSKLASGIAIGGGKDTYIYNVSIKQTYNGIHIERAKNEQGATYVDVDNVNIAGMDAPESAGILVEGTYNNFSNMRIASVNYGVLCTETGSYNSFRNLHPLAIRFHNTYSVGFWDKSDGNVFDTCYSDQFAVGYLVEENTRSIFNGCFSYWYSSANDHHVGYESAGKFNSIIASGKVFHRHSVKTDAYLYIGAEGGQGVVLYPMNSINSHIDMLKQHCKTSIIVYHV